MNLLIIQIENSLNFKLLNIDTNLTKWMGNKRGGKMTVKNKYRISAKTLEDRVLHNTLQTALYIFFSSAK